MIISLPAESTMITDSAEVDVPESPVVVADYSGSDGIGIIGIDNSSVYIPYRMVKEVCKVMLGYAKGKP